MNTPTPATDRDPAHRPLIAPPGLEEHLRAVSRKPEPSTTEPSAPPRPRFAVDVLADEAEPEALASLGTSPGAYVVFLPFALNRELRLGGVHLEPGDAERLGSAPLLCGLLELCPRVKAGPSATAPDAIARRELAFGAEVLEAARFCRTLGVRESTHKATDQIRAVALFCRRLGEEGYALERTSAVRTIRAAWAKGYGAPLVASDLEHEHESADFAIFEHDAFGAPLDKAAALEAKTHATARAAQTKEAARLAVVKTGTCKSLGVLAVRRQTAPGLPPSTPNAIVQGGSVEYTLFSRAGWPHPVSRASFASASFGVAPMALELLGDDDEITMTTGALEATASAWPGETLLREMMRQRQSSDPVTPVHGVLKLTVRLMKLRAFLKIVAPRITAENVNPLFGLVVIDYGVRSLEIEPHVVAAELARLPGRWCRDTDARTAEGEHALSRGCGAPGDEGTL